MPIVVFRSPRLVHHVVVGELQRPIVAIPAGGCPEDDRSLASPHLAVVQEHAVREAGGSGTRKPEASREIVTSDRANASVTTTTGAYSMPAKSLEAAEATSARRSAATGAGGARTTASPWTRLDPPSGLAHQPAAGVRRLHARCW